MRWLTWALLLQRRQKKQRNVTKERWMKLILLHSNVVPPSASRWYWRWHYCCYDCDYSDDITLVLAWWHPVGCAAPARRLESLSDDVLHHLHLTSGGGPGGLRGSFVARPSLLAHLVVVGDGCLAQLPFKVQLQGELQVPLQRPVVIMSGETHCMWHFFGFTSSLLNIFDSVR